MKSILKKVMFVSVIATSQAAIATDFYVDGFGYDIISAADLTCRLTDGSNATGDITIPEKVTYKGKELTVTSIGDKVFSGYESLTSVVLPTSITSIGESAFSGCSNLAAIFLPTELICIENGTFSGCSNLPSISIPNSVSSIGDDAFSYCSNLASISIPNSVSSIGSRAFSYCSDLVSAVIPNSVTSIGKWAFMNCSNLASISIPNSVSSIGEGAFSHCSSLSSVVIPNSVTWISTYTFSNCSSLEFITIPNSVTTISSDAFTNCSENLRVVIPNSVNRIDLDAFTSIKEITIADGNNNINIDTYGYGSSVAHLPFETSQIYIGRNILTRTPNIYMFEVSPFTDKLEKMTIGGETTYLSKSLGWEYAYHRNSKEHCPCKLNYLEIQKGENKLTLDFDIKSEEELEVVINRKIGGTTVRPDILTFGDDLTDTSSQNFDCSQLKNVTFGKSMSEIPANCLDGDKITTIYMRNPQPPTYEGSILQTTYTDATLYVPKGALEAYQTAEPWKTFWDIQEIDMDSGLDDITLNTNKTKPDVSVDGNLMRIHNADGMTVSVYNPDGSQVWQTDSYTGDAIELHPGMHIVRVGNRAIKLAI